MKARVIAFALALAFVAGPAASPARAWDDSKLGDEFTTREAWHRGEFRRLDVRFSVGSLEVVGHDGDSIVVWLVPHCEIGSQEDCEDAMRRVHMRATERGKTLEMAVKGGRWFDTSRVQVEARIEVPASLALKLDMGVGELSVTGVTSDVDLNLGVGEATVRSQEKAFQSARLNVGIGEAVLVKHGESREHAGVFGSALKWRAGKGRSALDLNVGIGEASVYLD